MQESNRISFSQRTGCYSRSKLVHILYFVSIDTISLKGELHLFPPGVLSVGSIIHSNTPVYVIGTVYHSTVACTSGHPVCVKRVYVCIVRMYISLRG